jgi:cell division transport system ATP-binding protein
MATHDAGIVNQMQRRVVEISQGRIVRDENQGGYQQGSVPLGEADTAPIAVVGEPEVAEPTPLMKKLDLSVDPDEIPEQFPWELRA